MARYATYSVEDIISTGEKLEASGKRVNAFAISRVLGGGNNARINEVWNQHIENRANCVPQTSDDEVIELPAEVQNIHDKNINLLVKQLERLTLENFKTASNIAEKRVSATIEEYKAKIVDYDESEQDAIDQLESMQQNIEELNSKIDCLMDKNEKLISENSKLKGTLEAVEIQYNETNEKLELKEAELTALGRELGKLEGQLESLNKN